MTSIKRLNILFLFIFGLLFSDFAAVNAQVSATQIENPKSKGLTNWVNNQDGILNTQTVDSLNNMINRLYDSTSCQIAVVVINGDKQTSARELSMDLYDSWKVGMQGKDNGLILLVVTQARQCFFRTGYGLEDVITDAKSTRIFNQIMKPYFIKADWDGGVLAGTNEAVRQIYQYYDNPQKMNERSEYFGRILKNLLLAYFLIGIGLFILALMQLNNSIKNIQHTYRSKRVNTLRSTFRNWIPFVTFFAVFTIPIYIIIYNRKLNKIRKEKIFCSCGCEMKLLSEKEEDEFLNHTQQLEETLHSRDYDVWLCPQCGQTRIYCYEENSSYTICPVCHAKTFSKLSEEMIHTGVFRQRNILRTTYYCKNCRHREVKDQEMNDSSPFLAGAAVGSMMGGMSGGRGYSSGGFGGFSGGSFGGGFSGGGGGGGSW